VVRIEGDRFAPVVCGALRRHVGSTRLQALGCLALANLACKSDKLTLALVQNYRCHEMVVAMMQRDDSKNNPHTAAAVLWTLVTLARELSDGSELGLRDAIKASGAVQLALACLAAFPTSQPVQTNAKLLFTRLGVSATDEPAVDSDNCCIQ